MTVCPYRRGACSLPSPRPVSFLMRKSGAPFMDGSQLPAFPRPSGLRPLPARHALPGWWLVGLCPAGVVSSANGPACGCPRGLAAGVEVVQAAPRGRAPRLCLSLLSVCRFWLRASTSPTGSVRPPGGPPATGHSGGCASGLPATSVSGRPGHEQTAVGAARLPVQPVR